MMVINDTLWGEMDVTSPILRNVRNAENRVPRWYSHIK
jgi:hypothetical protein